MRAASRWRGRFPCLSLGFLHELGRHAGEGQRSARDAREHRTAMSAPLSRTDLRALQSLIDWWDQAGVETAPVPVSEVRASRSAPPTPAERARPAPARATAAAARAAGYGGAAEQNARDIAAKCATLDDLKAAVDAFEGCPLKATATQAAFARGAPAARVMVVGEAPGREEDREGKPFVGEAGQLLDRMLAAIGLDETSAYITNLVFWRPPGNRKPTDAEIESCRPFVERHIELAKPDFVILAGGISAQTLLRQRAAITRLRGKWAQLTVGDLTLSALPIFHPAFLLRRPQEKAKAWADLLSLKAKLTT